MTKFLLFPENEKQYYNRMGRNNMITPQTEIIRAIDWSHASLKPGEEKALCQYGNAVIFRIETGDPRQAIVSQCPEWGGN